MGRFGGSSRQNRSQATGAAPGRFANMQSATRNNFEVYHKRDLSNSNKFNSGNINQLQNIDSITNKDSIHSARYVGLTQTLSQRYIPLPNNHPGLQRPSHLS